MKLRKSILLTVALLTTSGPVAAQNITGEVLVAIGCTPQDPSANCVSLVAGYLIGLGYSHGIFDQYLDGISARERSKLVPLENALGVCLDSVSTGDAAIVVSRHIQNNPQKQTLGAATLIIEALNQRYPPPC